MIWAWVFNAAVVLLLFFILRVVWFLWKAVNTPLPPEKQKELEEKEDAKLKAVQDAWSARLSEEIRRVWDQMQGQVKTTEHSVSQKLQQANDTFARVTEELGRLQKATEQVEQVGRNVADLQNLLRAPKIRGGLGEFLLADLMGEILPGDCYVLQYEFSDGERVDAAIRLRDRLVPVDSKFPFDQFKKMVQAVTDQEKQEARRQLIRDVKQHIDVIAQKYIRSNEGTFDFALMYIPAENVYYETVIKEDGVGDEKGIFQHAVRRRVIPVSPNSFYAYLQVILQGLRGFAVEQRAREILAALMRLQKDLGSVRDDFDKAGKQLGFAVENFNRAEKHLSRFEDRLEAIEGPSVSSGKLPAPSQEEARAPHD